MSNKLAKPSVLNSGQVDDDGDALVPAPDAAPQLLMDAGGRNALEQGRVGDEDPLAFGEDRVVGCVPRDPEAFDASGRGSGAGTRGRPAPTAVRGVELRPRGVGADVLAKTCRQPVYR